MTAGDARTASDHLQQVADAPSNLSAAELRHWLLGRLDRGYPLTIGRVWRLTRTASPEDVAARVNGTADDFPAAHSRIVEVAGKPFRIAPPAGSTASVAPDVARVGGPAELLAACAGPFDLRHEPPFRVALGSTAADELLLAFAGHRIAFDDDSADAFVARLLGDDAVAGGRTPNALLADGVRESRRDGWRTYLAASARASILPDHPLPPLRTYAADTCRTALPSALADAVTDAAATHGIPAAELVRASALIVVSVWTRERDVVLGVDVTGTSSDVGRTVLPIRVAVDPDLDFRTVVARLTASRSDAEAIALPLAEVVDAVAPERDLRQSPLFQVLTADEHDGGVAGAEVAYRLPDASHDLTARIEVRDDGVVGLCVDFAVELFERGTVERFASHVVRVLEQGIRHPDRLVRDLDLLSDDDHALLERWGHGPTLDIPDVTLHALVEAQVARTPDAPAVTADGNQLTYRQLDEHGNRIAHVLRRRGVGPGDAVGVVLHRSTDMVTALLGVLKAGAAYVPVDPRYPEDRVRYMLDDSAAVVVVTQDDLRHLAGHVDTLCVDTHAEEIHHAPTAPLAERAAPDDLAYVIYTSGSTGKPKGVMISHRNVVASTIARDAFYDSPPRAFLLLSSIAFDSSVAGLYWTLTTGGCLVVATPEEVVSPALLLDIVRRESVSHLLCVPTLYAELVDLADGPLPIDVAIVAGEPCPPRLVDLHQLRCPATRLVNEYGPTEATVWATAKDIVAGAAVTIGGPVANVEVAVVDERMRRLPVGVPGELVIGGPTLSCGYLGRADLTADAFVVADGRRWYRTGDLVRLLLDGSIDFIGRRDGQVKLRGYRIEIGEVESVLAGEPGVDAAAAVVRRDGGNPRLCAFVASSGGVDPDALLARCREQLPEFMVPSGLVILHTLPKLPNGKLDRRQLESDPALAPTRTRELIPPRNPLEVLIVGAFEATLNTSPVSVDDDFFALGGHSLLLAKLAARLRANGIDPPMHLLYDAPSPESLAAVLDVFLREGLFEARLVAGAGAAGDLDLQREARLAADLVPQVEDRTPSRKVLLTGATGYLGAFLLHELITQLDVDVHCLVRASDEDQAVARIEAALREFRLWDDRLVPRIVPVPGDLSAPLLGLAENHFDRLADEVDAVYHSGAMVNFVLPYHALKGANVDGTRELLRLAMHGRRKRFHFVSTADVFLGTGSTRPWKELDIRDRPTKLPDGYLRSKWVAEAMVANAADRGVPTVIYRPALTMGHTATGACHTTDFLVGALRGHLAMGVFPDLPDEVIPAMPVDFVSRAIVHISQQDDAVGQMFHLANDRPAYLAEMFTWMRSFGYSFDVAPYDDVRSRMMLLDEDHPLFPLAPAYPQDAAFLDELYEQSGFARIDTSNTSRALAESGISCAPADERWAHLVFRYLVEIGYLPEPTCAGEMATAGGA